MAFTNRGGVHWAILKAYKTRDMQVFLHNIRNEIFKILKSLKTQSSLLN